LVWGQEKNENRKKNLKKQINFQNKINENEQFNLKINLNENEENSELNIAFLSKSP